MKIIPNIVEMGGGGWLITRYINEGVMGDIFNQSGKEVIRQYKIPGSRYIVDYYCEQTKTIYEFDGPRHYIDSRNAMRDINLDILAKEMGLKIQRLPYFVQIFENDLFPKGFCTDFPHGFISNDTPLPSDFCDLGIQRFHRDLETLPRHVVNEILLSLKWRADTKGDWRYVVPTSVYEKYWNRTLAFSPASLKEMGDRIYVQNMIFAKEKKGIAVQESGPVSIDSIEAVEADTVVESIYQTYKRAGGTLTRNGVTKQFELFQRNLNMEFRFASWVRWISLTGDLNEAQRFWHSVDAVVPIT